MDLFYFKNISSAMEAPSTCTPPAARIRSTPGFRCSITSPEDQRSIIINYAVVILLVDK